MSEYAIEVVELIKDFKTDFWKKEVRALDGISFQVPVGSIFGLIGPNGAGKTTTLKILTGLIWSTSGQSKIFGYSTSDIRSREEMGYLPEQAYYYDYLKTEEVIDFYGRLFGISKRGRKQKTDELLNLVGLSDKRGLKLRNFSKGMLQRIGIAQALVNDPKLIIFDEPMSGLDPMGRKDVRDIILRLRDQGKTILFSSHILSDVETLCDYVGILVQGKLRSCGAIADIMKPRVKNTELVFRGMSEGLQSGNWGEGVKARKIGNDVIFSTEKTEKIREILEWAKKSDLELISVIPHKETLEDIFVEELEGM